MQAALASLDAGLRQVLETVALTVQDISAILRKQEGNAGSQSGTTNMFGDAQLQVDCDIDELLFNRLASCSACAAASSEEQPEVRQLQGSGYTVAFDPLDGSSIVGSNFAVGTIFGIWPGNAIVGRTGRQQAAAAYAVYGPRTLLVWARPVSGNTGPYIVEQWALNISQGTWSLVSSTDSASDSTPQHQSQHESCSQSATVSSNQPMPGSSCQSVQGGATVIGAYKNIFAPANLRCAAHNKAYRQLVDTWIDHGLTLRYTGGMVPDVHHILAKGGGVFVSPASKAAPAKLRLVYECAPLSLIIEAAGGASSNGSCSVLDIPITSTADRSAIVLGSTQMVEACIPSMTYVESDS